MNPRSTDGSLYESTVTGFPRLQVSDLIIRAYESSRNRKASLSFSPVYDVDGPRSDYVKISYSTANRVHYDLNHMG